MYSRGSDQIVQLHWLILTFTVRIWPKDCFSYVASNIRLTGPISSKTHSLYAVYILSSGKAVNLIDLHPFLRKANRKLLQRASKWFKLLSWCFVIYTASLLSRNSSKLRLNSARQVVLIKILETEHRISKLPTETGQSLTMCKHISEVPKLNV